MFFRVASDPSLSAEQLVDELVGLLTESSEQREDVKAAIKLLEQFWSTHKLEDIEKAEVLFRMAMTSGNSKNLERVSNGVTFLMYIVRLAQPDVTQEQKPRLLKQFFETIKPMYIFQGVTADVVWLPEAERFFNVRVGMMVEDYRRFVWKPETVDRSIYPKASSKPYTLNWPSVDG